MTTSGPRYDAFISYRHMPHDMAIATELQNLLEKYKPPRGGQYSQQRISRIFRDQSELPVTADLTEDIYEALRSSRFLVVICTPDLPLSPWCLAEIEYFKSLHDGTNQNILTLLAAGTPNESFPQTLRFEQQMVTLENGRQEVVSLPREPLAANVVAEDTTHSLKLLKNEFLRIAAPLLGCRYDDLYQRHRRRRTRRTLITAVAGLLTVSIVGGLGYNAVQANNAARQADQQAHISQAQRMAGQSRQYLEAGDRAAAVRLATEASSINDQIVPAAYGALFNSLYSEAYPQTRLQHENLVLDSVYSPDGRFIATAAGFDVYLWDAVSGERLQQYSGHDDAVGALNFSPDGKILASASDRNRVILHDRSSGQLLQDWQLEGGSTIQALHFNRDGSELIVERFIDRWRLDCEDAGAKVFDHDDEIYVLTLNNGPKTGYNLYRTANTLLLRDETFVLDLEFDITSDNFSGEFKVQPSTDGRQLLIYNDGQAQLWELESTQRLAVLNRVWEYGFISGCILPSGEVALSCSDNTIRIYNRDLTGIRLSLYGHIDLTYALLAQPDSAVLISGSHDGTIKIWDTTLTGIILADLHTQTNPVIKLRASPDGKYFMAMARNNAVQICRFYPHDAATYFTSNGLTVSTWWEEENHPVIVMNEGMEYAAYTLNRDNGEVLQREILERERVKYWEHDLIDDPRFTIVDGGRTLALNRSERKLPSDSVIWSVAFNPSEDRLAMVTESNRISVWDVQSGTLQLEFEGTMFPVFDIAYTPDGSMLYGTSQDGTVTFWEAVSGMVVAEIYGMRDLYYPLDLQNPDGWWHSRMTGRQFSHPLELPPDRIPLVFPARMSADGQYLIAPTAGGIKLFITDVAAMQQMGMDSYSEFVSGDL